MKQTWEKYRDSTLKHETQYTQNQCKHTWIEATEAAEAQSAAEVERAEERGRQSLAHDLELYKGLVDNLKVELSTLRNAISAKAAAWDREGRFYEEKFDSELGDTVPTVGTIAIQYAKELLALLAQAPKAGGMQ